MRKFNGITLMVIALVAAFSMGMLSSCGGSNSKIESFEISHSIKTLQTSYKAQGKDAVYFDSLPIYSVVEQCITWPERLGDHRVDILQDTLLLAVFGTDNKGIEDAMIAFSKDPIGKDDYKMVQLDTVPTEDAMLFTNNVNVSLREVSQTLLVYDITKYCYMGGAHGSTTTSFVNYDIDNDQVLTYDKVFKADTESDLLEAIRQELYAKYNVESDKGLEDAGIFVSQISVSHNFYISDYNVVFFYNQYELAPYAFGSIEVDVPYFKIDNCLTPEAQAIFKLQ